MHKCPKCNAEFEGKFCPECGEVWQEEKVCPQCGAKLNGSVRFCTECGHAFFPVDQEQQKNPFEKLKAKLALLWQWAKTHKKIAIISASGVATVLLAVIISLSVVAGINAQYNGTYYAYQYAYQNEKYDKTTYFTLQNGTWTDEEGKTGTYERSGEKITLYADLFGEKEELYSGTVKNGVLLLKNVNLDLIYCKENHKHKYGEWEITKEATCIEEGMKIRTCRCKKEKTKVIETLGKHTYNKDNQCSICGEKWDYTEGLEYTLNGDTYSVSGASSEITGDVVIPYYYNKKSVTAIGARAFKYCSGLTSVKIPDSVTSIGEGAFDGCSSLTSIDVDENNTVYSSIDGVLFNKDQTTLICYPAGKQGGSYTIPNSVTSIGDDAFYGCSSLTSVTIGNGVTSIGDEAFECCSALESVTIGNSVTGIGSYAFAYCSSLTSVTIGNSVASIGDYAFQSCSSLTSVTIPDSVASIGDYAFQSCSGLMSVTIGNNVTSIGYDAFHGCSKLTSVEFKNTSGWHASLSSATSGTGIASSSLENTSTAATYLRNMYCNCYWKRS